MALLKKIITRCALITLLASSLGCAIKLHGSERYHYDESEQPLFANSLLRGITRRAVPRGTGNSVVNVSSCSGISTLINKDLVTIIANGKMVKMAGDGTVTMDGERMVAADPTREVADNGSTGLSTRTVVTDAVSTGSKGMVVVNGRKLEVEIVGRGKRKEVEVKKNGNRMVLNSLRVGGQVDVGPRNGLARTTRLFKLISDKKGIIAGSVGLVAVLYALYRGGFFSSS